MNFKDLTGQRFGRLVAINDTGKRNKHGGVVWLCQCDCGNTKEVASDSLTNGSVASCGCLWHEVKNLVGQRFGRLIVIEFVEIRNHATHWLCQCECGNLTEVRGSSLSNNSIASCGCLLKESVSKRMKGKIAVNRKLEGEASKKSRYNQYKRGAEKRNLPFELTLEQAEIFFQGDCYYCGIKPSQEHKGKTYNGSYVYNGIDRIDNSIGYIIDNCVSCCKWCNIAKLNRTQEEFIEWAKRLTDNLSKKNLWRQAT